MNDFQRSVLGVAAMAIMRGAEPSDIYRWLKELVDAAPEDVRS